MPKPSAACSNFQRRGGPARRCSAVWISGFYGCGKACSPHARRALDPICIRRRRHAEGLVADMPSEVRAALGVARRTPSGSAGSGRWRHHLGWGLTHPVKAVLEVILRAVACRAAAICGRRSSRSGCRAGHSRSRCARSSGTDFEPPCRDSCCEDRCRGRAERKAEPRDPMSTPDGPARKQFAQRTRANRRVAGRDRAKGAVEGRKEIPLTLIILDEVQQFIREDPNISLSIQTITEQLTSKFKGRLLLVCTGQAALGDTAYLEKLLGGFRSRCR